MLIAHGPGAWWNANAGTDVAAHDVPRGKQTGFVIVKALYVAALDAFAQAGIVTGVERYAYPAQPEQEAANLADGIAHGAKFAVVDAEAEWEGTDGSEMERLCAHFAQLCPGTELYACTDTRGGRMLRPYQQALGRHVAGWMPMIYPKDFQQTAAAAFAASLDGPDKDFKGLPIMPAIQTYDGVGAAIVRDQIAECRRRGLAGWQAYTIAHASDEEWAAFVAASAPQEDEMDTDLRKWLAVSAIFKRAATYAEQGQALPPDLVTAIKYLIAA